MTTTNNRFVTKNGLDNNANSITNLGVAGASLTQAGAFALTLTTTGATNITLPTSGTLVTATALAAYLPLAGGTLTNNLVLSYTNPIIILNAAAGANSANLHFNAGGLLRWRLAKDTALESTGNAGSNLALISMADDGTTAIGNALTINRASMAATFGSTVTATGFTGPLTGAHNGTVGATTPSTGAFTTASATTFTGALTGNVTGSASLNLLLTGGTLSNFLTLHADPTSALHATTKQYVDNALLGLAWKQPVRATTTAAGTLATSFANGSIIDGVTLVTGDRILLKNQAAPAENGIYTVNATGAPTRATDFDLPSEVNAAAVFVKEGTLNADLAYTQTATVVTVGTTGMVFAQFSGGGVYTAGTGLTLSSNQFSLTNTSVTVGSTAIALGGTSTTLAGLTGVTSTVFTGGTFSGSSFSGTNGFITLGTAVTTPAFYQNGTVTAAAGTAYAFLSRGTLAAAANSDGLFGYDTSSGVVATGTFTGLSFYGMRSAASSWSKTGTGTITNAYGIYADAPTIGTNNYAAYLSGATQVTTLLGIGTTFPTYALDLQTSNPRIRIAPAVGTNNALVMFTNTGGTSYVGLDASTPTVSGTGYSLAIYQGGALPIVLSTSGTERARIDASGNFFLGTTATPSGIGTLGYTQSGTTFGSSSMALSRFTADNDGSYVVLTKSRGATNNTYTAVTSGDTLGRIQFRGADGTSTVAAAEVVASADGTITTNGMPTRLVFATTPVAGAATQERMRIDSAGNVSIGNVAPGYRFHVYDSAANAIATVQSGAGYGGFYAKGSGTNNSYMFMGNITNGEVARLTADPVNGLLFSNTTGATERMRIDMSGNVGIGAAPSTKLDVNGGSATTVVTVQASGFTGNKTQLGLDVSTARSYLASSSTYPLGLDVNGVNKVNLTTTASLFYQDLHEFQGTQLNQRRASTDSAPYYQVFLKSRGTQAVKTTVVNGDAIGATQYYGFDGTSDRAAASIVAYVDGVPATTTVSGALSFQTTPAGTAQTPIERMRIDSLGNITPGGNASQSFGAAAARWNTIYTTAIADGTGGAGNLIASSGTVVMHASGTQWSDQAFYTAGTERARLNSTGLGIGVNPTYRLDVAGAAVLGGTAGNQLNLVRLSGSDSNAHYLETTLQRMSTGADWTTAGMRMQERVDSTYMGWMQFSGTGNNSGISFGTGSSITSAQTIAERMRIDGSGNVQIGTTATRAVGGVTPGLILESSTNPGISVVRNTNSAGPAYLTLGKSRGTTAGAVTAVLSGDYIGSIDFAGADGVGMSPSAASVYAMAAENFTSTAHGTMLLFGTTPTGSTTYSERMRIDASGNVGIGGASSGNLMELVKGVGGDADLTLRGGGNAASLGFSIQQSSGSIAYLYQRANGPMVFGTNNVERMRIGADGNIGIGTSSNAAIRLSMDDGGQAIMANFNSTHANGGYLRFSSSGTAIGDIGSGAQIVSGGGTSNFGINVRGTNSLIFGINSVEKMRLDGSGNVGIGTTNPSQKLVVSNGGAAGLEIGPTAVASAPALVAYNRSTAAYIDLTDISLTRSWQTGSTPTERMRIDAAGNVGIGTAATIAGVKLNVAGGINTSTGLNVAGTGGFYNSANKFGLDNNAGQTRMYSSGTNSTTRGSYDFRITDSVGTLDTSAMVIDSAGNVGIGITTPSYKLDVLSTSQNNPVIRIVKANSGAANEHGGALIIANQGPANLARAAGTYGGRIEFQYSQPTSQAMQVGASIYSAADGAQSGTGTAAFLGFCTSDATGGGANNERMRIDSNGNVGIGTTASISKLEVLASTGSIASFKTSNATGGGIRFGANATEVGFVGSGPGFLLTGIANSDFGIAAVGALVFGAGNVEKMRIDGAGRLLVGKTSTPGNYKFDMDHDGAAYNGMQINDTGASGSPTSLNINTRVSDTTTAINLYAGGVQKFYVKRNGAIWSADDITGFSDARVKTDIETIPAALAKVEAMRGVTFKRIDSTEDRRSTGVIAQEVQAVLPEAVHEDQNGMLSVAYGNLAGVLIEAVKELSEKVKMLEARLAKYEA